MMRPDEQDNKRCGDLPDKVKSYLCELIAKMRFRGKVRTEVSEELAVHFADGLQHCPSDDERQRRAEEIVAEFGDIETLARLLRRAKKRCRPLWLRAIRRAGQTAGVIVLLIVLYSAWFMAGKPNPTVDYLARVNAMNRPMIAAQDNAWTDYERAVQLHVGVDEELRGLWRRVERAGRQNEALTEDARAALAAWVEANGPAWEACVAGSRKRYCYHPYRCDPNKAEPCWLMGVRLPPLGELSGLARVGVWRSRFAAEAGRVDEALDACLTVARVARHWQTRLVLVEQLWAIGKSRTAHQEILNMLEAYELSGAQLRRVQAELAAVYGHSYPLVDISGERIAVLDTIQHVFTDGGPGGGHLVPRRVLFLMDDLPQPGRGDLELKAFLTPILLGRGVVHARRDTMVGTTNALFDRLEAAAVMTPYERRQDDVPEGDELLNDLGRVRYALLWALLPAVDRASEQGFRQQALHEATLAVLALQRWRLDKGGYPERLTELAEAGYLARVPGDPYAEGPLVYRTTNDGFTLYSLGPNFADDGGVVDRDSKGRPEAWPRQTGDAVFWPVATRATM